MIRAAICLGIMLVLLMGTVVLILTGDAGQLTGSGDIIMGILIVLAVVLSVALTDRQLMRELPHETDDPPMPQVDKRIRVLFDSKRDRR